MSAKNNTKPEESDEDVPGDFFDDFLKEDFMAGLDIVDDDEWDEEKIKRELQKADKGIETKNEPLKSKDVSAKAEVVKIAKKTNASNSAKQTPATGNKKPKTKKKPEDKKPKRTRGKVIDADEFDIRRDPKKTKRDIERDKERCEKDKEKKIISEKLSLVETGLVPPGMEMEIDIEEIKRQKEKVEKKKPLPQDLREHIKNLRGSKSPSRKQRDTRRKSPQRRSASPIRRSSPKQRRTRSPIRTKRSPIRTTRSPIRTTRSPIRTTRSPIRTSSNKKSPVDVRLRPSPRRSFGGRVPVRRSRSRSPNRYYRSRQIRDSPLHSRHRNRSASRESDREMWLKRRRSRSRSQRRRQNEKKSFLQEIAEKLNETRPPLINMMAPVHYMHAAPMPMPVPAPTPVPPPSKQFFPTQSQPLLQKQYDPYDQNFFIGTPSVTTNLMAQPEVQMPMSLNPLSIPPVNSHSQMLLTPNSMPTTLYNKVEHPQSIQEKTKVDTEKDISKLFQDKKITLSEFLTITAKPEAISSNPAHLQEKIKVISRCHEAIKFLGNNEKKYSGKLIVHRTDNYKVSYEKNKSPLVRNLPVTFPFTRTPKKFAHKSTFTKFISNMLQAVGLSKDGVQVKREPPTDAAISNSQALPKPSPPPAPLFPIRIYVPNEVSTGSRSNAFNTNQLSKLVQTDVFTCESCEKRKQILYKVSAVQCGGNTASFSVSTQVTEEDFFSKIPKTQSLASLTPAQLLANSRPTGESLSATLAKFTNDRTQEKDSFDIPLYSGGNPYSRPGDSYNTPRFNAPRLGAIKNVDHAAHFNRGPREEIPQATYSNPFVSNPMRTLQTGRGRDVQINVARPLDPNHRYAYNEYY